MKKILALAALVSLCSPTFSQSTYEQVYNLFQANCTVGCHSGGNPSANLNLKENGDMSAVYSNILEVTPINPTAAGKGHKLIDAGYPERSFLLRKCATSNWDSDLTIEQSEGNSMPQNSGALDDTEIELIRQWIIYGAKETGQIVDTQTIDDYYNGLGMSRIEKPLTPEEEGFEGYQIHLGPFFLNTLSEVEYRWKYDLQDPDSNEVYRTNAFFNDESHHFILWKFGPGVANGRPEGMRPATQGELFTLDINQVTAWQDPIDNHLPPTTAYKWEANTILDLNYHILNYSQDSILPAECYVNIYTQPNGTADLEMNSTLIPINALDYLLGWGEIGDDLVIPNGGQEYTFTESFGIPIQIPDWHVWSLFGHTHERGTDYDIYLNDGSGNKGEQIYEGFYDPTYTFNQGSFDWEHPPVRIFEPLLQVNMSDGFIHEAKYVNNTADTIRWGLTTEDEMMLFAIQYTDGPIDTTSIGIGENENDFYLSVAPNPFSQNLFINYKMDNPGKVSAELFDIYGKRIIAKNDVIQTSGGYKMRIDLSSESIANGTYFLKFTANEKTKTERILHIGK